MKHLLLPLLLLLPLAASAQIYKTTDEKGNVLFTDKPPASGEAEQVELRETNTAAAPPALPRPKPQPTAAATAPAYRVAITSPPDETSIPMGPGNFSVSAEVHPAMGAGRAVQLYVDGAPWGDPQQVPSWDLTNVFRGAHDLTVAVVDGEGKQLAGSEPVRVYVHRPSINFRNRAD
jgi:hypothetical protein